jgi:hypothetical protein
VAEFMAVHVKSPNASQVARLWRQWTEVVGLFATHDPGRLRVEASSYVALYRDLLHACAVGLATADAAMGKRLQTMIDLATPWLTAHSLDVADRDILHGLWAHCRGLNTEFNGYDWRGVLWRYRTPFLWLAAILVMSFFFAVTAEWTWDPLVHWVVSAWGMAWIAFKRLPTVTRWLAVGVTVSAVGFFLLARTTRS